MKTIAKDELYRNLSGFLKAKGIELTDGSYVKRIRQGCGLLTDAINCTQKAAKRAKGKVDVKMDQLRQTIHEATAPKPAAAPKGKRSSASGKRQAGPKPQKT